MSAGSSLNIRSSNAAMVVVFQQDLPGLFQTPVHLCMAKDNLSQTREFYEQVCLAGDVVATCYLFCLFLEGVCTVAGRGCKIRQSRWRCRTQSSMTKTCLGEPIEPMVRSILHLGQNRLLWAFPDLSPAFWRITHAVFDSEKEPSHRCSRCKPALCDLKFAFGLTIDVRV